MTNYAPILSDELLFTPMDHTHCMAMPADFNDDNSGASASMYSEDESERTDDVNEYRRICIDFIEDIQHDYEAWVDYYKLPAEEDSRRRSAIHAAVKRSCEWIAKVAQSIKSVDIAMNDGLQKMAEATAGRPLEIGVFVNKMSGYTEARAGMIKVTARASARPNKKITIGSHFKDAKFRVDSTCGAYLKEESPGAADEVLSADLTLHAEKAERRDLISFTITFVEVDDNGSEIEKRGLTTIVHIV